MELDTFGPGGIEQIRRLLGLVIATAFEWLRIYPLLTHTLCGLWALLRCGLLLRFVTMLDIGRLVVLV